MTVHQSIAGPHIETTIHTKHMVCRGKQSTNSCNLHTSLLDVRQGRLPHLHAMYIKDLFFSPFPSSISPLLIQVSLSGVYYYVEYQSLALDPQPAVTHKNKIFYFAISVTTVHQSQRQPWLSPFMSSQVRHRVGGVFYQVLSSVAHHVWSALPLYFLINRAACQNRLDVSVNKQE